MTIQCPCCKSDEITVIGKIPPSTGFAGRHLSSTLEGHSLYSCKVCNLYFRYPRMQKDEMDALYRSGAETSWTPTEEEKRPDWDIASRWVDSTEIEQKVLDVGCFSGEFLTGLGKGAALYGIEIHQQAANRARESGIIILGGDFKVLDSVEERFDIVTSFDVIEHVYDPKVFLNMLAKSAKPNGKVIISTGNTMALSWRLMGSRYWYCTNAEHISFINPDWCRAVAGECGLKVDRVEFFSRAGVSKSMTFEKIKEAGTNLFYKFVPFLFHLMRKLGYGVTDVKKHPELLDHPPSWMSSQDHFIICFIKNR